MEVTNFTSTNYEKVNISTDHLGNIYVYNNKVIKISQDDGLTWKDITPTNSNLIFINKLLVSHDNYIYISTLGAGILKYEKQLATPKQLIVNTFNDLNKNCTLDAGEEAISNIKVIVDNNYIALTDKKGICKLFYTSRKL
ncbi:MAG: hypothetical protein IPL95_08960 [Saprospiraceae bacterium]|nr:hypothetical protein [Saprospiraceae bacterium]